MKCEVVESQIYPGYFFLDIKPDNATEAAALKQCLAYDKDKEFDVLQYQVSTSAHNNSNADVSCPWCFPGSLPL